MAYPDTIEPAGDRSEPTQVNHDTHHDFAADWKEAVQDWLGTRTDGIIADLTTPYTDYTPLVGRMFLGSATIPARIGRYKQIGKTVHFIADYDIDAEIGGPGNILGLFRFDLPVTPRGAFAVGTAVLWFGTDRHDAAWVTPFSNQTAEFAYSGGLTLATHVAVTGTYEAA